MRPLPKAELHVHLEGTLSPEKTLELAARNNVQLPDDIIKDGQYQWTGFFEMITKCYDGAASCIRTAQDYEEITYDYLTRSAKEGVIYTELIISPDHARMVGLGYEEMVEAVAKAIDKARHTHKIEARLLSVIVRHLGVEHALNMADEIIAYNHPYVVGVNLAGDEVAFPARDFKAVFDKTNAAGLKASIHAGEATGPESVYEAIDILNAARIGHGVRSIEDSALIQKLIDENIILEVSPSSNVEIGVYPDYAHHPLRALFDAGVKICLNSDDPPFFFTTIGREYKIAAEKFGFTSAELLQLTKNAVDFAFADDELKSRLHKEIQNYEQTINARTKTIGKKPRP